MLKYQQPPETLRIKGWELNKLWELKVLDADIIHLSIKEPIPEVPKQ